MGGRTLVGRTAPRQGPCGRGVGCGLSLGWTWPLRGKTCLHPQAAPCTSSPSLVRAKRGAGLVSLHTSQQRPHCPELNRDKDQELPISATSWRCQLRVLPASPCRTGGCE